jgi:uncharacterized protein YukJ
MMNLRDGLRVTMVIGQIVIAHNKMEFIISINRHGIKGDSNIFFLAEHFFLS